MFYYAVRVGAVPGIYENWDECRVNVNGYPGAKYKKFDNLKEAQEFMREVPVSKSQEIVSCSEGLSEDEFYKSLPGDCINAFVDGSYNPTKKTCGAGVVVVFGDELRELTRELSNDENISMRNIYGEISAAEMAFGFAVGAGAKKLVIYHDYEGISKWCTGEWAANKERTKEYRELYRRVSEEIEIEFIHVKGHTGNPGNEAADRLAKRACGLL